VSDDSDTVSPAIRALRNTFTSLRSRNFRLYFIGQLISNTGNWLTNVALTLFVLRLGATGIGVGILAACQYGPMLFLSIPAGAIADRSDKRRMLLLTQSLEMCQSAGLAALAFLPHPPLAGIYALSVAGGTLLALDNPLRRSFVTEMVPREDRANAVVLYSLVVNLTRISGPALAGVLVVTLGFGWCFAIDAATYIAVLVCLALMRPEELFRQPRTDAASRDVLSGLRYVRSMPHLWISFAMLALIGTLTYNFSVTLPLFVTRALRGTNREFTVLYSVYSAGAVAGALVVARRRLVDMRYVVIGAVSLGLTVLILAAMPAILFALPAVFAVGIASVLYTTATTALVQVEAAPEMHGRVLALQTVLSIGTTPIGGPLLGWLADVLGSRSPLVLGGAASLVAALFGFVASRCYPAAAEPVPETDAGDSEDSSGEFL
jgi:MFS family permease